MRCRKCLLSATRTTPHHFLGDKAFPVHPLPNNRLQLIVILGFRIRSRNKPYGFAVPSAKRHKHALLRFSLSEPAPLAHYSCTVRSKLYDARLIATFATIKTPRTAVHLPIKSLDQSLKALDPSNILYSPLQSFVNCCLYWLFIKHQLVVKSIARDLFALFATAITRE